MSEVNGKTLSISFRIDEGVIEHNNRIFIAKNLNGERVQNNITHCRHDNVRRRSYSLQRGLRHSDRPRQKQIAAENRES